MSFAIFSRVPPDGMNDADTVLDPLKREVVRIVPRTGHLGEAGGAVTLSYAVAW